MDKEFEEARERLEKAFPGSERINPSTEIADTVWKQITTLNKISQLVQRDD